MFRTTETLSNEMTKKNRDRQGTMMSVTEQEHSLHWLQERRCMFEIERALGPWYKRPLLDRTKYVRQRERFGVIVITSSGHPRRKISLTIRFSQSHPRETRGQVKDSRARRRFTKQDQRVAELLNHRNVSITAGTAREKGGCSIRLFRLSLYYYNCIPIGHSSVMYDYVITLIVLHMRSFNESSI